MQRVEVYTTGKTSNHETSYAGSRKLQQRRSPMTDISAAHHTVRETVKLVSVPKAVQSQKHSISPQLINLTHQQLDTWNTHFKYSNMCRSRDAYASAFFLPLFFVPSVTEGYSNHISNAQYPISSWHGEQQQTKQHKTPYTINYKSSDLPQNIAIKLLANNYFSIFIKARFSAFWKAIHIQAAVNLPSRATMVLGSSTCQHCWLRTYHRWQLRFRSHFQRVLSRFWLTFPPNTF